MIRPVRVPSLGDLAFTSYVFPALTSYDESLSVFQRAVGGVPDLTLYEDLHALHAWLNAWRCRLPLSGREHALEEVRAWFELYRNSFPSAEVGLHQIDDAALASVAQIFADLANRPAGDDRKFGATATSKTLHALHPHVFLPWDRAIRAGFQCDGSGESYVRFLRHARGHLKAIERECRSHGVALDNLHRVLDQGGWTLVDLLNQYYWVTITRG
ncbi:MAG: hypothetical protein M5U22_02420 [Thermoleophilia bacterium]|nr:hypothetical protein [Thermoleophilia bacterium]